MHRLSKFGTLQGRVTELMGFGDVRFAPWLFLESELSFSSLSLCLSVSLRSLSLHAGSRSRTRVATDPLRRGHLSRSTVLRR
jgi:hypothetical protein